MSVVWHTAMSLDGFIAGPGDTMDWVFEHYQSSPMGEEAVTRTGAMLVGRRSYDAGSRDKEAGKPSGDAFGEEGRWEGPQFVFTHHPPDSEPNPSVTFVSGEVAPVMERAKAAAGGREVLAGRGWSWSRSAASRSAARPTSASGCCVEPGERYG